MTKGKARARAYKALATRLTLIWLPQGVQGRNRRWVVEKGCFRSPEEFFFCFEAQITPDVVLSFYRSRSWGYRGHHLSLYCARASGQIGCREGTGQVTVRVGQTEVPGQVEQYAQFAAQWMPFFRRGCWLSGFPIEASAHEKAEWMQGFTQEEIEAWNLKF